MFHQLKWFLIASLLSVAACSDQKVRPESLTYAEHIAPILQRNCMPCHFHDGPAPFPLTSFDEVLPKAKMIAHVTTNRIMPPWPADPTYSHFANETYLSEDEITMISEWVANGVKPGDTASFQSPALASAKAIDETPDLIVSMEKAVKVPGNNTDLFLVMKLPFELPHDTFIRAIEFVPGKNRLVHHMNAHILQFETSKKVSLKTGKSWVNQDQTKSQEIHRELGLLHDDGTYPTMTPSVCNYLPGSQFSFYPPEIGGYRIGRKNAFYLNDLHYGPSPVDEMDSGYFKIYFADKAPKRPVSEFQIGTLGLSPVEPKLEVPPNTEKTFHIRFTVPQDISVLTLVPHMHLIGKSYLAYAIKPGGDTIPLIRIPRWDFRWQYFYQPPNLLKIPRNSVIEVTGVYDNTASNPNNPFNPPRTIAEREGSMKTTDEMFQLIITYVPYQPGDEQISQRKP